jgi:asparaginyl-tRNA synthetase
MRLRSQLSFAVHQYFNKNGFSYVNTPIITGSDAEGAGEMFKVTNFNLEKPSKNEDGSINYKEDFFGKETNLTVSGQLEAETYALGLGQVYTFGPTFRAENSNTSRHLAEFWMIEPEVAFCDLDGNMDLAEDFIKYVLGYVLENCNDDLEFLENRLIQEDKAKPQAERAPMALREKLRFITENNFKRVSYTEAIDILKNSKPNKKKKFNYIIEEWGADLQSEHERFLVEKHFKCPVILFDYPAKIKAFYMRLNEDGKTVRAMDILFPGIGEIVGGSQREERLEVLQTKMKELDVDEEELWWYLDTRKFGTCVHSGFGLGFERLVLFATGMSNIRDVIPFPRTPKNAEF